MKRMAKLRYFDFTLIIAPILLASFGLVMIYSSSMVMAVVEGLGSTYFLKKQFLWLIISLIAFAFFCFFPYNRYQKLIKLIMLLSIGSLIGVLLFGNVINNSKAWFAIGPFSIQPSEFVKIGLIIYLSSIYSKKQEYINEFSRGVLPPLVLMMFVLALVLLQPDIGTTAIIFLISCTVIFSAGIHFRHLFILMAVGAIFLIIASMQMVTAERISRITGAYKPFETPASDGYHLIQSYLAIGGGGLTGEGLGQSVQKLGYLWGAHTDFIMSIIAEELGFVGVLIVISLILTIVLRGIFIARKCKDSFGSLLAIGISSMIGIQAFTNLGAISGVLPITGVPLPFVSYGGSSLLAIMISMGILNNIAKSVKERDYERAPSEEVTSNRELYNQEGRSSWSS